MSMKSIYNKNTYAGMPEEGWTRKDYLGITQLNFVAPKMKGPDNFIISSLHPF